MSFNQIVGGWRILCKISPKMFNNYTVLKYKCSKTNLNRNTVRMLNLLHCVFRLVYTESKKSLMLPWILNH